MGNESWNVFNASVHFVSAIEKWRESISTNKDKWLRLCYVVANISLSFPYSWCFYLLVLMFGAPLSEMPHRLAQTLTFKLECEILSIVESVKHWLHKNDDWKEQVQTVVKLPTGTSVFSRVQCIHFQKCQHTLFSATIIVCNSLKCYSIIKGHISAIKTYTQMQNPILQNENLTALGSWKNECSFWAYRYNNITDQTRLIKGIAF